MRMLNKLLAGAAVVATVTALSAGTALADPPSGTTPKATDVVGVGSNTTEYLLDQLSVNYNTAHKTGSHIYSWEAVNPTTGAVGDSIVTKKGCAAIPRPDGSSAGITTLASNIKDPKATKDYCVDFGRSSRARAATDPPKGKGGVLFVALAKDNVTYASLAKGSHAPANLTKADLTAIYSCTITHWNKIPGNGKGSSAKIDPLLPQPGSGTLSFFETAIGVLTPGKCVTQPLTLEENEGINKIFAGNKNAIIPFSAGKWVAQAYHSPACAKTGCTTLKCKKPAKGQNAFGCDVNGVLGLNDISGSSPTVTKKKVVTLNPKFDPAFVRTLYDVVRYSTTTSSHIPAYLTGFFGSKGYFCSSKNKTVMTNYGFLTTPLCGLGF